MGWFVPPLLLLSLSIPLLLLSLSIPLSSTVCHTTECKETSAVLLAFNASTDACTDIFTHSCLTDKRVEREANDRKKIEELKKNDMRVLRESIERRRDWNDSISKGIRRLNESCMNFEGSLAESLMRDVEDQLESMPLEKVAGFASRGRPIFFKTKFTQSNVGNSVFHFENADLPLVAIRNFANRQEEKDEKDGVTTREARTKKYHSDAKPMMSFLTLETVEQVYDFEAQLFKFKPTQYYKDRRTYTYDEFIETFSSNNWSMANFLEGIVTRQSVKTITVIDPHGILYAVNIISNNRTLSKEYVKFAHVAKMNTYLFQKRKYADFPNRNKTESTKSGDCLSLITRFFPFLISDVRKNTTNAEFSEWVRNATSASKRAFYRRIDDSDWLEPSDKIALLDILKKIKTFVYRDEPRDEKKLEYEALADGMNSTDLLHNLRVFEGSPTNCISSIEDGAYTLIHSKEIFMQMHDKKAEFYTTIPQVGMARIINTMGHEIGHHVVDHLEYIITASGWSPRFMRHVRNAADCYRRVADESLETTSLFSGLSEVNNQRTFKEVVSDIMGVQVSPEAYSLLEIDLIPGIRSKQELYYRAVATSEFYCVRNFKDDLLAFLMSTHPVSRQRIEYIRLFDTSPHFDTSFNCTRTKPICPYIY